MTRQTDKINDNIKYKNNTLFSFICLFSSCVLLSACVSVVSKRFPVSNYKTNAHYTISLSAPYKKVWQSLNKNLIRNDWKINSSSQEGGIITTDERELKSSMGVWPVGAYNIAYVNEKTQKIVGLKSVTTDGKNKFFIQSGNVTYHRGLKKCLYANSHIARLSFFISEEGDNSTKVEVKINLKTKAAYNTDRGHWALVGGQTYQEDVNKYVWNGNGTFETYPCPNRPNFMGSLLEL